MFLVNLLSARSARVTTLALAASKRRSALDAVATAREAARTADHERAEAAKALVSPELVEAAERERAVRSMIGPGPSPSESKYRARKDEHAPLLAPSKLTKDTGHGAPEATFTGKLVQPPDGGSHFERRTITYSLPLGCYGPLWQETRFVSCSRPHHGQPTDARSTKGDRFVAGAGRVISGQTRQVTYAAKAVFAKRAGTGSVAYQSQVRMMSRWRGALATASAPRLAEPSRARETRQPLPSSVTAWRPLTIDGRKRRR